MVYTTYQPILKGFAIKITSPEITHTQPSTAPKMIVQGQVKVDPEVNQLPKIIIDLEDIRLNRLQRLNPQIEFSITIKDGTIHKVKAPLFDLIMHPLTDEYDH